MSLSLASVKGVVAGLVYLILVPMLVFFFLKDKNKILDWLAGIMPRERRLTDAVWKDVNLQIANYVRGKVWEIFIVWGASFAVFMLLDLKYATLLSLFVGLSVLIPYIGATVMFLPVTLMAYFQWGWSPHFGYVLGAYLVIQFLDGNLLAPCCSRKSSTCTPWPSSWPYWFSAVFGGCGVCFSPSPLPP